MRALESLIKKHGGWKNINGVDIAFALPLKKMLMDNLEISEEELNSILSKCEYIEKQYDGNYDKIASAIDAAVDAAYNFAKKKIDNGDMSGTSPIITIVPSCILKVMCLNSIFHKNMYLNIKANLENAMLYFNNSKNEMSMMPRQISKDTRFFADFLGYALMKLNETFIFQQALEGKDFWNKIYLNIRCMLNPDTLTIKRNVFGAIDDKGIYADFVKAHPEYKKEITDFCKNKGN